MQPGPCYWQLYRGFFLSSILAFVLALFPTAFASAGDYRVDIGDVLELSAASIPEFRHRSAVGVDGEVSFPLVGTIPARDRSIKEILAVIQLRVSQKVLRRRAIDGSEHSVVIDGDEVSLTIAEYNPIFVKGDVAKPGSYPYRPGITVRQAIALAGGFNTMRGYVDDPYILAADLRSQYGTLSNEYVREQARIARVQTELGRAIKLPDIPEASATANEVKSLEIEQLDTRKANFERERLHLTEVVKSLSANLEILEKQSETEAKRAEIDQEDLSRVEALVARGMAPVTRLSDTKRLVLLSASRATEIEVRAEQVKQRRTEEERKLQKLFDDRRIQLLQELQTAKLTLAATASKIAAVTEKMFIVGAAQSQIGRAGSDVPGLTVFRKSGSGEERLDATEETELRPRDVVEITIQFKDLASGNANQAFKVIEQKQAQPNQIRTQ